MICPECGGTGEDHPCSYRSRNSEFGADCPKCNGTGKIKMNARQAADKLFSLKGYVGLEEATSIFQEFADSATEELQAENERLKGIYEEYRKQCAARELDLCKEIQKLEIAEGRAVRACDAFEQTAERLSELCQVIRRERDERKEAARIINKKMKVYCDFVEVDGHNCDPFDRWPWLKD